MSRFEKRIEQIQSPLRKHGRPASSQAWTASVLTAALLVGVTTAFCQGQPTRLAGASQDEIIWETLGIRYVPSMQEYGGVRVVCVRADSPAAKRGIATGDTIVGIGQRHIESSNDMHWIAQNWRTLQAEESVMMEVIRAGIRYVADVSMDGSLASASQDEIIWETFGIRYVPSTQEVPLTQEYGGVRVVCVRADSPAAKRGIATGDTIVGIGQRHIESSNDMHWIAQNWRTLQAEESVMMEVIRAGIRYVADVSLDSKPLKVFCKQ